MAQPGLVDDPRFARATDRSTHADEIDDLIARWTRAHPLVHLEQVLERAAVPAMRIFTIADIFADPHYRARGTIVHAPDEDLGTVAMAQVAPRLSQTPGEVRHAGRHLGQDSRRVLQQWLSMDAATLDALQREGVVMDAASRGDAQQEIS